MRTLVLAERKIDQTFYDRWRKKHQNAAVSMVSRDEMLEAAYEEIECDMQLVGVSAIEDKLAVCLVFSQDFYFY